MKNKRIASLLIVFILVLSSFTAAFAGQFDIKNIVTNKDYDILTWSEDVAVLLDVADNSGDYIIEVDGEFYNVEEVIAMMQADPDIEIEDAVKELTPVQKPDKPGDDELKIESVSSITATTIEVTFSKALESVEASDFNIAGIGVESAEFKSETGKRVVVLKTTQQLVQSYTLEYKGLTKTFIGKDELGAVVLSAEKYEVEIIPSENKLTPVEITATLVDFPEGAEASIDFSTTFGKVVKSQTTKNGVTTFQLTPLETLNDQTAIVSGKVIEVKNPISGQTFPEFRNSTVGSVNVRFIIKTGGSEAPLQSYEVKTAYAENADRVYLKATDGIGGVIGNLLDYNPQKLIVEKNPTVTKKQMYLLLHDVLFSNIQNVVDENKGTGSAADIKKLKEALNNVFVVDGKDIVASDLRNILRNDAFGTADSSRFNDVYKPLGATKKSLEAEINAIEASELQGILDYYKLVAKFVILDNIKDTQAPQTPDNIYPVEYIYNEGSTLVLVLPGQRSNNVMDYDTNRYQQDKAIEANYLRDNSSHQVVFVNNLEKDKYEIKGDPTFKLEDADNVRLISVLDGRYQVEKKQITEPDTPPSDETYCPIPYSVDVDDNDGYTEGTEGGSEETPGSDPKYTGTTKLSAINYTTSEDYRLYDCAIKNDVDKLGEIKVVFSEPIAVLPTKAESALNPANWTINGIGLDTLPLSAVNLRLASTNPAKQLRDTVVITFNSFVGKDDKNDNKWINSFIEEATGRNHRIEVSKMGDWASLTDRKNIVDTESKDYDGRKENTATLWNCRKYAPTGSSPAPGISYTGMKVSDVTDRTYIVRAIAEDESVNPALTNKDVIRVSFNKPMKIDGIESVLEKANYALNGNPLPVNGTSIKLGVGEDICKDVNTACSITIELPKGYLENDLTSHILTVSGVRGAGRDDRIVDERIQLPYARNYTIIGNGIEGVTKYTQFDGCNYFIWVDRTKVDSLKVENRPYYEEDGKTPINVAKYVYEYKGDKIVGLKTTIKDFFVKHITITEQSGDDKPVFKDDSATATIGDVDATIEITNDKIVTTKASGVKMTDAFEGGLLELTQPGTFKVVLPDESELEFGVDQSVDVDLLISKFQEKFGVDNTVGSFLKLAKNQGFEKNGKIEIPTEFTNVDDGVKNVTFVFEIEEAKLFTFSTEKGVAPIGKTTLYVEVDGDTDGTKYTVTFDDEELVWSAPRKSYRGTVDEDLSEEQIEARLKVVPKAD